MEEKTDLLRLEEGEEGGEEGGVEVEMTRWRWTSPRKTLPMADMGGGAGPPTVGGKQRARREERQGGADKDR